MYIENNNNNNDVARSKVQFEVALDEVGFGLYSWLLTGLTGLSIIGYACIVYSSTIIVRTSKCDLDTTPSQHGVIVAVPIVATILGAILWGYLADRHGRRKMALASFSLATIFNTIASFSVHWGMLVVFQFIAAFMASGQYSIMMSLLSECVPMARRNLVVLVVASLFMLSQGIMALLVLPIQVLELSWSHWRTTLVVYSIPSVICFIWTYFMEESPKYIFLKKGEDEALEILKRIHRINHLNSKEELQVKGLLLEERDNSSEPKDKKSLIKELFKGKLLKYLIIMTTLAALQQTSAFIVWLPNIADQFLRTLNAEDGKERTICSLLVNATDSENCILSSTSLLFVFGVGALQSLFNIVLVLVVGKVGRRNMVMLIAPVCGISGIIVNLVPNIIASVIFFVIFLLGILLLGLYTAITLALFPTHLRALAVSLTMAGGRVMLAIVAVILNLLLQINCALGFYIFASLVAASAIIVSFLPDERYVKHNDKTLENTAEAEMNT